jgi:polysaccharide biosynthesis/export protein
MSRSLDSVGGPLPGKKFAMQAPNRNWQGAAAHACRILMVMLAAWMSAAANVHATENPSNAPKSAGEYRMTPGDHVAVVIYNEPQLSGDFIVDDGGKLLMPLLGAVPIGGLTQAEAQKLIQDRLADGVLVQPTVSLRIKEYRPVSIFGYVKKPGSYRFYFGQTVRAVIASAGGEGRLSELPSASMSEYILADERVRLLETRRLGLLVRKLRLVAEQNASSDFMMPQLIGFETDSFKVGMYYAAEYYAAENEVFSSEMEAHRHQLDLLQQQQPRLEAEMTALTKQLANEQRRANIIQSRVAELDDYKSKGLVRTFVLNEQQREEAHAGAEVARLEADIAGLQRQKGDLDIRIEEAKAAFKRQVMNGLEEALQNLREIEVTLETSRELRDYRAEEAGIRGQDASKNTIMISRTGQQGPATFKASYDTVVEPGDVIEVKHKVPQATGRPAMSDEASLHQ